MAEVFKWQDEYTATGYGVGLGRRRVMSMNKTVTYQLRVLGKDGGVLESASLAFPVRYVSNAMLLEVDQLRQGVQAALWFVSPLVGGCAKGYVKWIGLEMATDDVAKMDTVSIELAEQ